MRPLTTSANASKFNIQDLVRSINQSLSQNNNYDAFICGLTPAQWDIIASYMQPFSLANGQVLMEQGAVDRTLYFVENGTLSVHFEDPDGSMKLAMINPGSVVGEGAFFSRLPRNATVVATGGNCKLWCLTPIRFTELANRQPAVALELAMSLGALIAKRLFNSPRRVAVT